MYELHNDLPFLPEKKKLKNAKKLVFNFHDENDDVIHITNLKQILNHGLVLKKVYKVIKFNQEDWLKRYTDMNTKPR